MIFDNHHNEWKAKLNKRRLARNKIKPVRDEKITICAMFVPQSKDSRLMIKVQEAEEKIKRDMLWNVKILEQSGIPLSLSFIPKFPLQAGCPRGNKCVLCGNSGIRCSAKSVVYQASCKWCDDVIAEQGGLTSDDSDNAGENIHMPNHEEEKKLRKRQCYIGETSRPFRERVCEHMDNLRNGATNSFIIQHWMEMHQDSTTAPEFKWSILDSYKDALRRQLCEGLYILESGSLNRKHEFNRNLICRMEATLDSHLSDSQLK